MRRATVRNAILAISGTLAYLATIVFADLGCSSSSTTVSTLPVATVSLTPSTSSVPVGATVQLSTTLDDANGAVLSGRSVTWSSSSTTVATVSSSGLVTGVALGGPVTITALSEGKSGTAQVTVTSSGSTILTGEVMDYVTGTGIGTAVVAFTNGLGTALGQVTTAGDGTFTSPALADVTGGITMTASKTGYVTGRVLVVSIPSGTTYQTSPIPLVQTSSSTGGISGTVLNARTSVGIASASVSLFNNVQTAAVATTTANSSGVYTFAGLAAGTYRLTATATGFQAATRVGVAVGNNGVTSGQDIVLSPSGTNDLRIVLTWGVSPSDLDAHLTGPNADGSRFHVYYSAKGSTTAAPYAALDVDNTHSYGPETITITQFQASGTFRFSVHDYSDHNSNPSSALGQSSAKVEVYTSAGLMQTFFVPNQAGTLWTVFEMTGTITNPVITPRNAMSYVSDPSVVPSPPVDPSAPGTDAALIGSAVKQNPKVPPPH